MFPKYLVKLSSAEPWKTDQMLSKSAAVEVQQMIQNLKYELAPPYCS